MATETLLKADSVTLNLAADKQGRIRVTCGSWSDVKVMLPGEQFGAMWSQGQVRLLRLGAMPIAPTPAKTYDEDDMTDQATAARTHSRLRDLLHSARQELDRIGAFASDEFIGMVNEIKTLASDLPSDGKAIEQAVSTEVKPALDIEATISAKVAEALAAARTDAEASLATFKAETIAVMKNAAAEIQKGRDELAAKTAETEALKAQLDQALKPETPAGQIAAQVTTQALPTVSVAPISAAEPETAATEQPDTATLAVGAASTAVENQVTPLPATPVAQTTGVVTPAPAV